MECLGRELLSSNSSLSHELELHSPADRQQMKILFITSGDTDDPSSRVRVHQFLPFFDREYKQVAAISLAGRGQFQRKFRRLMALLASIRFDTIVVQKVVLPRLTSIMSKLSKRLIYDIDDGVFVSYPELNYVLPLYDVIVTGNRSLEEHVSRFNVHSVTIPSVVDETRFDPNQQCKRYNNGGRLVIGWLGHGWNLPYLHPLKDCFFELANDAKTPFVLKVVSNGVLDWRASWVINKPWRLEEEVADVASFDVGIMPLPGDRWSELKCGYKALVYMAMGKPVVVTPVGVNSRVVQHGINGYHAETPSDWVNNLSALLQDAPLRLRMGEAGRQFVASGFCIRSVLPQWLAVFRGDLQAARNLAPDLV